MSLPPIERKTQLEYREFVREVLRDAIDLHVHVAPEWMPRRQDFLEVAEDARDAGMRALAYKPLGSFPTVGLAYAAKKFVPEVEVLGGIVLDYPVGGLNPHAVKMAIKMGAKIVWMPVMDAAYFIERTQKVSKYYVKYGYVKTEKGIRIAKDGKLVPEAKEIIDIIASARNVILATGHISPEESLTLIEEARKAGVEKIIVTHASGPPIGTTIDQMRQMVKMGAYLEEVFSFCMPFYDRQDPREIVEKIKTIGAKHFCLSSDLGSYMNPPPVEGLKLFIITLMELGVTRDEIDLMIKKNPAKLIGFA